MLFNILGDRSFHLANGSPRIVCKQRRDKRPRLLQAFAWPCKATDTSLILQIQPIEQLFLTIVACTRATEKTAFLEYAPGRNILSLDTTNY